MGHLLMKWNIEKVIREQRRAQKLCEQCGRELGFEYFLNPVCGKCCRANHRAVTGRK